MPLQVRSNERTHGDDAEVLQSSISVTKVLSEAVSDLGRSEASTFRRRLVPAVPVIMAILQLEYFTCSPD
jgi:hypothetical protein